MSLAVVYNCPICNEGIFAVDRNLERLTHKGLQSIIAVYFEHYVSEHFDVLATLREAYLGNAPPELPAMLARAEGVRNADHN